MIHTAKIWDRHPYRHIRRLTRCLRLENWKHGWLVGGVSPTPLKNRSSLNGMMTFPFFYMETYIYIIFQSTIQLMVYTWNRFCSPILSGQHPWAGWCTHGTRWLHLSAESLKNPTIFRDIYGPYICINYVYIYILYQPKIMIIMSFWKSYWYIHHVSRDVATWGRYDLCIQNISFPGRYSPPFW
jgi:hypothetical protein